MEEGIHYQPPCTRAGRRALGDVRVLELGGQERKHPRSRWCCRVPPGPTQAVATSQSKQLCSQVTQYSLDLEPGTRVSLFDLHPPAFRVSKETLSGGELLPTPQHTEATASSGTASSGSISRSTSCASRCIPWSHAVGENCKCKGAFFPAELRYR